MKFRKSWKANFWINIAPNKKMKKTDTPQNQLKNLPDWQSQVIWTIFKGAMAIFSK